jgi:site-specific DNA-cytosine methylase
MNATLEHETGRDSVDCLVGHFRVLVACEYSGTVRDAFAAMGHDAMSCDLLPSEKPGKHYQGDVRDVLDDGWDLMVCHPPCTHLAVSGARWFKDKVREQAEALDFVRLLLSAPIPRIALENPVSVISSKIRKPDQVIQPWQHGHGETKATCLWLKGLPKLEPSNVVEGREQRIWKLPPSADRWKERSRTFPGIAAAMASQWGSLANVPHHLPRTAGATDAREAESASGVTAGRG